jgi:hypothetical protein
VPYYSWNNRGGNEMRVWVPRRILNIRLSPEQQASGF